MIIFFEGLTKGRIIRKMKHLADPCNGIILSEHFGSSFKPALCIVILDGQVHGLGKYFG